MQNSDNAKVVFWRLGASKVSLRFAIFDAAGHRETSLSPLSAANKRVGARQQNHTTVVITKVVCESFFGQQRGRHMSLQFKPPIANNRRPLATLEGGRGRLIIGRGGGVIRRLMGHPFCGPKTWCENQFGDKDFNKGSIGR
jgi:hypothetical protein